MQSAELAERVRALAQEGRFGVAREALDSEDAPHWPGLGPSATKEWISWSQHTLSRIQMIMDSATVTDCAALAAITLALGNAASCGVMPSFADPQERAAYTTQKLSGRTLRVAEYLLCAVFKGKGLCSDESDDPWVRSAVARLMHGSSTCEVVSIGGGPGYDAVALALVSEFMGRQAGGAADVRAYVLDYEAGWQSLAESLAEATLEVLDSDRHNLGHFGITDLTEPLEATSNQTALARVAHCDLWVASYCVAENAIALRSGEFAFFRDVFAQSKPGALFLFVETTHRLWPELVQIAFETWFSPNCEIEGDEATEGEASTANEGRFMVSFPSLKARRGGSALLMQKPLNFPVTASRCCNQSDAIGLEAAVSDSKWAAIQKYQRHSDQHKHEIRNMKQTSQDENTTTGANAEAADHADILEVNN